MRKTTLIFKALRRLGSYKNLAAIVILMAISPLLMSFKYDKTANGSKTDSSNTIPANFVNSLTAPFLQAPSIDKTVFTLKPELVSFLHDFTKMEGEEYGDMKSWGKPYFELYDSILAENGLPVELKYLSVIESGLQSKTGKSSGAIGPWQLMPYEGKRFGLLVKHGYDERTDYAKSTEVAAKLLKELYGEFGDWLLVVGAYNCGIGGMKRAIAKANSRDFWKLQYYLPAETRYHVKKFIATHYIFEGCGGWTTITAAEASICKAKLAAMQNGQINTVTTEINGKFNSSIVAGALFMSSQTFDELNPNIDQTLLAGKPYSLRLPENKMALFVSNKQQILEKSIQLLASAAMRENNITIAHQSN